MGWALLMPDGKTVRVWNAHAQDDPPREGEVYVPWDTPIGDLSTVQWNGTTMVPVAAPPPVAPT